MRIELQIPIFSFDAIEPLEVFGKDIIPRVVEL